MNPPPPAPSTPRESDRRPRAPRSPASASPRSVALVAVFTALVVVASVAPAITVGAVAVPITLQTFAVLLTGLVLGPVRGGLALLLYLALGLAGLPVFARGASGLQVLAGPTAGYLVSFVVAAALAGWGARLVVRRSSPSRWLPGLVAVAVVVGVAVIHVLGIAGLMLNARLSLGAAVTADVAFLPLDLVKAVLAAVAAAAVHRAFPAVLVRD